MSTATMKEYERKGDAYMARAQEAPTKITAFRAYMHAHSAFVQARARYNVAGYLQASARMGRIVNQIEEIMENDLFR